MRRFAYLFLILSTITAASSCGYFDTKTSLKKWLLGYSMETVPPPPPENAFTLSQFGVTWYFDRALIVDVDYGRFANGDYWVVGPVNIIYIDPLSFKSRTGRVWNGSMVNPSPKNGNTQGYDSAMYGQYGPAYDPALNVGLPGGKYISSENPLALLPGSSLVSTISVPEPGTRAAGRRGGFHLRLVKRFSWITDLETSAAG